MKEARTLRRNWGGSRGDLEKKDATPQTTRTGTGPAYEQSNRKRKISAGTEEEAERG